LFSWVCRSDRGTEILMSPRDTGAIHLNHMKLIEDRDSSRNQEDSSPTIGTV